MNAALGKIKAATAILCWGCAAFSLIFTVRRQLGLFRPAKIAVVAAAPGERMPITRTAGLEEILQRRVDSLRQTAAWEEPFDDGPTGLLNRPLLALRGVVLSGGRQWAAIAVDGSAKTVLAAPGQSLNGVKILTLEQTGMTCQWRGQKFFIPLE